MTDLTLDTARGILDLANGPNSVMVRGWASVGDLGSNRTMTFERVDCAAYTDAKTYLRAHDGSVYVPRFPSADRAPSGSGPSDAAWNDIYARAKTFVRPPSDLIWDSTRAAPGGYRGTHIVWQNAKKPYPITCSNFLMLLLMGTTWELSTYTEPNTKNSVAPGAYGLVGAVDIALQASFMLRSFAQRNMVYKVNTLAMSRGILRNQIQRGDILFFSKPNPENSWEYVRAGRLNTYPWNVYHVALCLSGGDRPRIMHSTHPGSATAVYEQDLGALEKDLVYIARIPWTKIG